MNNYLEQFKRLPREIQEAVSSENKIKQLEEIEAKYNLKLAKVVVRLMIKDIAWRDLEKFLEWNFNLNQERANELKKDLQEKIFNEIIGYLEQPNKTNEIDGNAPPVEAKHVEIDRNIQPITTRQTDIFSSRAVEKDQKTEELNFQKVKDDFKRFEPILNQVTNEDDFLKKVVQDFNLNFTDQNLNRRFINLIKSFFRDIRTAAQVEETLKRSVKTGGLALNLEQAVLLVKAAQDFKKKMQGSVKRYFIDRESNKNETLEDREEDRAKESENINQTVITTMQDSNVFESIKEVNDEIKKRFEGGAIKPVFTKLDKPLLMVIPQVKTKEKGSNEQAFSLKPIDTVPINARKTSDEKDLMIDIQGSQSKAIGPVEELAEITLIDLIRWGGGRETAKIVLGKINLLAELSLIKKTEAIKSWQRSPLYKAYLSLGSEALMKNKSIIEVIAEKESRGEKTLTFDDFQAIAELNEKLRF